MHLLARRSFVLGSLLLGGAPPLLAADLTDWLKFDAFGTLAAYQGDDPVAGARADQRTARTTSNKDWRFDGDSQLTAQFTVNAQGPVRGVLQLLSKDDVIDRFRPRVEWLYLGWDATPDLSLKVGRVVAPVFLMSDTRNIGFAQTAVRPNQTIYQINPITSIDGANLNWSESVGGGNLSIEAAAGKTDLSLTNGSIQVNRTASLAARWQQGGLTLRGGATSFELDGNLPGTQAALSTLSSGATGCTNCAAVFAQRFRFTDIKGSIATLAMALELGQATLQTEWARRNSNSTLIPDVQGWYLQGSYRIGAWTPYAATGALRFKEPPLGLSTAAAAPPAAAAANAAFDHYLINPNDRKTQQLGLRWDFHESAALKVQVESIKQTRAPFLGINSVVYSPNMPPINPAYRGPAWDGRMKVLSVNLDFVF